MKPKKGVYGIESNTQGHADYIAHHGWQRRGIPIGGVAFDSNGNLYGTTRYDTLPVPSVTLDASGNLFGTFRVRATFGTYGTVFELSPQ